MLGNLKLLTMASAMARHAATRHEVLAENIANADTAGYRAKDLEAFGDAFSREAAGMMSSPEGLDRLNWRVVNARGAGLESPNGNNVSLEDQMMRSVEAQQNHEAATAIYKKTIEILRLSLGRGA